MHSAPAPPPPVTQTTQDTMALAYALLLAALWHQALAALKEKPCP